jgi:DNA-directed RNA polymerase specialized sigma24 family protein
MGAAGFSFEPLRDVLVQAIAASLNSWPELHRRIFTEIHYGGKSAAEVARVLNTSPRELAQILQHCERKLYRALRSYRHGSASWPPETTRPELFQASACCRH